MSTTSQAIVDDAPGLEDVKQAPRSAIVEGLEEAGRLTDFCIRVIKDIPTAIRLYPSEIFRQAGLLIRQNSAVILFMMLMLGLVLGLTAHFIFTSLGLDSYIAAVNSIGSLRGIIQVIFGWIVAAKVGCGIVAELGAMRISEEIDAMEVMGVRSIPYLISTRVIAAFFVMPLLFTTGLMVNYLAGWLMNVHLLNTVSSGGFWYFLFLFQNPRDYIGAVVWALILSMVIILVSSYYGYTAKGGPVGVGRNTAQSMLVNLVLVSVIGMMLVQLLYGASPNAPIGN